MSTPDQEARTQRHLEYLDTLIAQGVDLATRLHQQSTTPSDLCSALAAPGVAVPFITPDVIASFAQINQTIRRAILVSRKLNEPLSPARPTRTTHDAENPVHRGTETPRTEFPDRVHSPDLEDRIGARPLPELIAALARELEHHPTTRGQPSDKDARQNNKLERSSDPRRSEEALDVPPEDIEPTNGVGWVLQPTTQVPINHQPNPRKPHPKPAQPPAPPQWTQGPPHPT